ncbi:hypothetical protein BJX99DRAFT_247023 [Aspergillus californicus]
MDSTQSQKEFVLCFDGTGNKFRGDSSDSNVLKIFRMLDRNGRNQYHYYQPGIGTFVASPSLEQNGAVQKLKSAYIKAKASAIGSTFADHVMGGYKFLMRYYCPGDQIYFFGFSRGAYVARFLAEMMDRIGLLEPGNEEMISFAWETFAKWQQRGSGSKEEEAKKEELKRHMVAFRETFCHPVTQICFLGLFDTVNSVPRFENAWMRRSKFPYTARTSAKVIRHAVSIDEHRAKFRQDLLSEVKPGLEEPGSRKWKRPRSGATSRSDGDEGSTKRDIEEVWFPGCHADIGGGWEARPGQCSLSEVPLLWMVHNAQKAGLRFDPVKLEKFGCLTGDQAARPESSYNQLDSVGHGETSTEESVSGARIDNIIRRSSTDGQIHDGLRFGGSTSWMSVLCWKLMEYLPFRRMDLQKNGSWKPIRWPLPCGEVRDIPDDAKVHVSAIYRLHGNPEYRPGNLIMGGGGRGKKQAPKEYGTGEWIVAGYEACPLQKTYIRKPEQSKAS